MIYLHYYYINIYYFIIKEVKKYLHIFFIFKDALQTFKRKIKRLVS